MSRLTLRLPDTLHQQLETLAEHEEVPLKLKKLWMREKCMKVKMDYHLRW